MASLPGGKVEKTHLRLTEERKGSSKMSKNLHFLNFKDTWAHRPSVGAHLRLLFAGFPLGLGVSQEVAGVEVAS